MNYSNKRGKSRYSDKFIRFSIGAKLVTIITSLIVVSLGIIIFLVSYFFRQDLDVSSRANNSDINERSAAEVRNTLNSIHSNSMVLLKIIKEAGVGSPLSEKAEYFFFEQNKQIAALIFQDNEDEGTLVNKQFLNENDINASLVDSFFKDNNIYFLRAASGDSVFLNASLHFSKNLLALYYPIQRGALCIIFSPQNLTDSFKSSVNKTYMINGEGDILIHPDINKVLSREYIGNREYVREIRVSPLRNKQDLYKDEGVSKFIAFTKLNEGSSIVFTSIEYDKLFEGIEITTRRNIYLAAAVLFLSILFIWFFSKGISTALKILSNAARKIEGGDFELNLVPKSRDEIGFLTASFQKMSKALSVFGRFTNREIAIKAMRGQIKPGGLPKHATVFFSDIRGFTEKSENFTNNFGKEASDKIVAWLNSYFTQMIECVEKTNGVVDKFIGDAVMAHWGTAYTAGSPAKDAFNGVKAALLMRKALVALNRARHAGDPGDPPINIGCGINTGIVTAGQLGSDVRMEYTVIGDPVNLASRIEALNKPLGTDILISESTWNMVKYFFITEEMPPVTVKGKEKPVRIFAVINHVSVTSGPKTLAEVRELLGIEAPDISKVDTNAEEKKYKIAAIA